MTDDEKCPHLFGNLPKSACSICKNGVTITRKKKVRKTSTSEAGQVDPFMAKVVKIDAGVMCPQCLGIRDDHGFCQHERAERYIAERDGILSWAEESENDDDFFAAMSALKRVNLRLGRDTTSPYDGVSLAEFHRLQAMQAAGVTPKWRKPRVTDPEELPV